MDQEFVKMASQDKDKLNFESGNRAVISADDQDHRYSAALQAARELNAASTPDRALKPFSAPISALSETFQRLVPILATGMAISVAGIAAAGIASALNSSKRAQNIRRRAAEETNAQANAARQIVLISQVVVYRRGSVASEVFDRRDDLAGKGF